jgi:AraC family transcriptional activator of pobA
VLILGDKAFGGDIVQIIEDFRGTATVMGMALEHFGAVRYDASEEIRPHAHGHYEFCLVTEGLVCYRVDGRNLVMEPGDLCVTRPGEFHSMASAGGEVWNLLFINIRELQHEELVSVLSISSSRILKGSAFLKPLFEEILREARNPKFGSVMVIHSTVIRLVVEIARQLHVSGSAKLDLPYSNLVSSAIDYIGRSGTYTTSLEEIANHLGVSVSWLSHRFRQETKRPIRSFLRYILVERARRLLEDNVMTISEVADKLGFPNPACFSAFFRSHQGLSPREYRQKYAVRGAGEG